DHWETLASIGREPNLSEAVPRQEARLDWGSLFPQAEQAAKVRADNNQYGFENYYWNLNGDKLLDQRSMRSDNWFLKYVQVGTGWSDYELLLRGLRELGAEPLILNAPMKGPFYDFWGVSSGARRA